MTVNNKCGGCRWAKLIPQDMTRRLCFGAPPQVLLTPKGALNARPLVGAGDDACSLYATRLMDTAITIMEKVAGKLDA